jgi:AcrR family transcriptional regulator
MGLQNKSAMELMGISEPATNTRDRLINTALNLFYFHGFHAIGIDQIIAEVGVTKTTFYNHFESKDELIIEAIKRRDRWEVDLWSRMLDEFGQGEPRRSLLALFDILDRWFNDPEFLGCIFMNAAAEFPSPHDPIHQAAMAHGKHIAEIVRPHAVAAGAADPDVLVEQLMLLIEGAIMTRHVHHDPDAAAKAREMAELLLQRELAADPTA